jgi:poly(A) polymerase
LADADTNPGAERPEPRERDRDRDRDRHSRGPEAHPPLPNPVDPDITPERLDTDAVRVVMRLRGHGHEAFLVGGCVRDLLLGHHPKDFDIATSATPEQVRALFRNSRLIGRRFRLAHVYYKGGKVIEVSTFRANPTEVEEPVAAPDATVLSEDGVVEGGIVDPPGVAPVDPVLEAARDFEEEEDDEGDDESGDDAGDDDIPTADEADVAPVEEKLEDEPEPEPSAKDLLITADNVWGTAVQDARRRDFTINGLFYDPNAGRVIDHVGGVRDLQKNEIRTIGDPEVRMREDPVRILRAVRFASKLELEIEPRTYAAMEGAVEDLPRCSAPRLLEETFRLIRTGHAAKCLELLVALDALKLLLPPIDAWLRVHGPTGLKNFLSFARALDAQVLEGEAFDDSMLLASILLPLSLAEPGPASDGGRPQVAAHIENLLQELLRTARLPRRIAERCRMILSAQRTLAGERRRRGGLGTFRQHPLFEESLKVFRVWVEATGERRVALEAWDSGGAPEPAADAPGPVKKRRRRRRRGGGGGAPGAGPASAPPASGGEP